MDKKMNWKITLLNLDVVIASAAMVLLVGLTFSGVIARYLIGRPFGWIEEVQAPHSEPQIMQPSRSSMRCFRL